MTAQAQESGIVETTVKELPILAVNVLDRLGYAVSRASKQLEQILAVAKVDEQVGRDWWHQEYRAVMRWDEDAGGVLVAIEISETKGGGTNAECLERCRDVIAQLREDALRAKQSEGHQEKPTIYGTASWGTEEDLTAAGYLTVKPQSTRLIVGKMANGVQYIQVPERITHAHAIVCGRTGVGKSTGFFIPNIVERLETNMIITEATPGDEAGELYQLTAGWRKGAGHEIYSFNPADMSSVRINPIDRVRYAPGELKAKEAEKLADLIVLNGERTEARIDPTWDRSEKQLLIPLILHAAASDPERGHFGALRWMLLSGVDKARKIIEKGASDVAKMELEGWMNSTSDNFRYGVAAGLITKFNPWITDQMVALTETTDLDFDALAQQLFTFYLAVPSRSRDSKLIGSLMMNFLLDYLLDRRNSMKYPTTMLLDEFTNFGKIASIADVLSIIRKAGIGLVLGFQEYYQLEQVYSQKEAQIIFDMPATQVYFRQKDSKEAKALSEALGRATIEEVVVSDSGHVQEIVQGRALATPDELINLKDEVIVFTPDVRPLKLKLIPPNAYRYAAEYAPPPERPVHEISEFIKRRGRMSQDNKPQPGGNDRQQKAQKAPPIRKDKERTGERPDIGDVWRPS